MAPIDQEQLELQQEIEKTKVWWSSPRFASVKRPYSAESIVSKRGIFSTTYRSDTQGKKLWSLLQHHKHKKTTSFGVPDPIQADHQYLDIVYTPNQSNKLTEHLPIKVDQVFYAQLYHDSKQREEQLLMTSDQRAKTATVDYLKPIIADVTTTGEIASIMKSTKILVERGAAGIHVRDQSADSKKNINLAGKVLVPTSEFINQLVAIRAQYDIMGVENLIVVRTDAEDAKFITSHTDPRDHPYILGTTNPSLQPLSSVLSEAANQGLDLDAIERQWLEMADLKSYSMAVVEELTVNGNGDQIPDFLNDVRSKSYQEARSIAQSKYRICIFWDWDLPRHPQGLFRYEGNIEAVISRSIHYANYADMLCMETRKLNLEKAQMFARHVLVASPNSLLCCHLSFPINWDMTGLEDMCSYVNQLAKIGFVWQFITTDGHHHNALAIATFIKAYKEHETYGYILNFQHDDHRYDIDVLNHQKISDVSYENELKKSITDKMSNTLSKL